MLASFSLVLAQAAPVQAAPINAAGWIFMLGSVTFVTVLVIWCFKKVLSLPPQEKETVKDLHSA